MHLAMAKLIGFRVFQCATIAVFWALCGKASPAESFRLVVDFSPPYEDLDNEKAPGFSIEVLKLVFAAIGRNASFETFPNGRSWAMIARGEADGIFSGPRTGERERLCSFPDEPLIQDRWVFFVRTADAGKLKFSSFDDLIGHRVAVPGIMPGLFKEPIVPPDLWKFLREQDGTIESAGGLLAFKMLAASHVDYVVSNLHDGMMYATQKGLSGKITPLLSRSVMENGRYICFAKGRVSPTFVADFSRALKQFKKTAAFQAIYSKYFPEHPPPRRLCSDRDGLPSTRAGLGGDTGSIAPASIALNQSPPSDSADSISMSACDAFPSILAK
jgi:polar amino acid transport system substrate-binding protein